MKILVVDGNWVAHRAYHSPAFAPNHTVYHFMKQILKYYSDYDEIHVVWDVANSTATRKEIDSEYKAQLKEGVIDNEFWEEIDIIKVILWSMGISSHFANGYEGDDVAFTIANEFQDKGDIVHIFTIDKDLRQAITDKIFILHPKDGLITKKKLKKNWNLTPEQIPKVLAIAGDASDNVKGIKGIGWKTAVKIVNNEKITDRIQKKFDDNQELIRKNLKLVILKIVPEDCRHIIEGKYCEDALRASLVEMPSLLRQWDKIKDEEYLSDVW